MAHNPRDGSQSDILQKAQKRLFETAKEIVRQNRDSDEPSPLSGEAFMTTYKAVQGSGYSPDKLQGGKGHPPTPEEVQAAVGEIIATAHLISHLGANMLTPTVCKEIPDSVGKPGDYLGVFADKAPEKQESPLAVLSRASHVLALSNMGTSEQPVHAQRPHIKATGARHNADANWMAQQALNMAQDLQTIVDTPSQGRADDSKRRPTQGGHGY